MEVATYFAMVDLHPAFGVVPPKNQELHLLTLLESQYSLPPGEAGLLSPIMNRDLQVFCCKMRQIQRASRLDIYEKRFARY
jgi:hypothetical protein